MSKKEVTVKGTLQPKMVATILEDILESFKKGKVVIQNGNGFVTLVPNQQISIELEASQKKSKEKLVLELSWEQAVPGMDDEGAFKISSVEPEPVEEPQADAAAPADLTAATAPVSKPVSTPVAASSPADAKAADAKDGEDPKKPKTGKR